MAYFSAEEQLLIKKYDKDYPYLTRFLDLNEQRILKTIKPEIKLFGGFKDSELKRASYLLDDFCICALKVNYNKKYYKITHRDVLGAILNTGITKGVIGDIVVADDIYILVCDDFKDFIISNIDQIKNSKVSLEEASLKEIKFVDNAKEVSLFIKSFRIDLLISQVFKLSRFEAKELFLKDFVRVNHKLVSNHSYTLSKDELVSVRGHGRFLISEIGNKSKSDNIYVNIKLYK